MSRIKIVSNIFTAVLFVLLAFLVYIDFFYLKDHFSIRTEKNSLTSQKSSTAPRYSPYFVIEEFKGKTIDGETLESVHAAGFGRESVPSEQERSGDAAVCHQEEHRVQAHIFVCFLALAMYKSLELWMNSKGLGNSPAKLLEEFREIRAMDLGHAGSRP